MASIGNEGALGLYSAGAPGVGKDVIGVASFDNTHANLASFTVSPGDRRVGYVSAEGAPPAPLIGTAPILSTGTPTSTDDACAALPAGSLTGSIALIRRGTCGFYQKALNAQDAGRRRRRPLQQRRGPGQPDASLACRQSRSRSSRSWPRTASPSTIRPRPILTWTAEVLSEPQPTGELISSFSSWGLAADLSFKPDLGAPGGSVRSTLPLEQGWFGNVSGTSMASPHVAGAVALLLEARPELRPDEVQARLQNRRSRTSGGATRRWASSISCTARARAC